MRLQHFALPLFVFILLVITPQAFAQRGGRAGGGGARGGPGGGGPGMERGGGPGGPQRRGGPGGGMERGGGPGGIGPGGGAPHGGGFGGGLSPAESSRGEPRGETGVGPYGSGGPGPRDAQLAAEAGPRPGANASGPGGNVGIRPGAATPGIGAAGSGAGLRPGVGGGGAGGPASGVGVRPGAGAGAPGAGVTAANRNAGNATAGEGAVAGAAAANRNATNVTGAQGAAAGAAVANRNSPQATGAEGAAAGAAIANRNSPQFTGAQGAAAGAAFASANSTRYVSAAALTAQTAAFRTASVQYPAYNPAMLAGYASAWQPTNVVTPSLYQHPGYGSLAVGLGLNSQPIPYDYGSNVVAQPTIVYVNGDSVGTPQQYADQASQIAATGQSAQPAHDSKWLPLGVFALVEGDATTSDDIFQLAVNPQGIIRGNYNNLRSKQVESISGSVDKNTQRAAWTIGGDQWPVYEAGVANLTKDATPILVHLDNGESNQVSLIRLEQPAQ